ALSEEEVTRLTAVTRSRTEPASRVERARMLLAYRDALVRDRHRSREFIEFLKLVDAAYPRHTAIKLILDNHSAHSSKEAKAWLAQQPAGRFEFTFTPKHGSGLNVIEGFRSFGVAPHSRRIQTGTQGSPHGCHGSFQPRSGRPHVVLQTRSSRLI